MNWENNQSGKLVFLGFFKEFSITFLNGISLILSAILGLNLPSVQATAELLQLKDLKLYTSIRSHLKVLQKGNWLSPLHVLFIVDCNFLDS